MTFELRLKTDKLVKLPKPAIMGIINVSPNSFFNPHHQLDEVLKSAESMVEAGVSMIDVGGEATNPNIDMQQQAPDVEEEIDRVVPAIIAIRERFEVLISVDTRRAAVMNAAVAAGADIINDQKHLSEPDALSTAVALKTPVCLMHFFNQKRQAGSVPPAALLKQIKSDLQAYAERCLQAGISKDRIILDPGFGQGNYGKNAAENFYLLAHLDELTQSGFPILSGWSRKSMIGEALGGVPPEQRLFGSVAADTLATFFGAHILRTHSVQAAVDAAKFASRVAEFRGQDS